MFTIARSPYKKHIHYTPRIANTKASAPPSLLNIDHFPLPQPCHEGSRKSLLSILGQVLHTRNKLVIQ